MRHRVAVDPILKLAAKRGCVFMISGHGIGLTESDPITVPIQHVGPFRINFGNIVPVNRIIERYRNLGSFHVPGELKQKCLIHNLIRRF
ncbi:hypothetical protein D3C77_378000 [compost metagenome]